MMGHLVRWVQLAAVGNADSWTPGNYSDPFPSGNVAPIQPSGNVAHGTSD